MIAARSSSGPGKHGITIVTTRYIVVLNFSTQCRIWVYSKSIMPTPFEPWLHYPSLTLENLAFVATLMRDVRDGAARLHDAEAGDTNWSFGCRVYSRTLVQMRRAAFTTPWLTVLPETHDLRFTFTIGAVPLKFYKGDADEVPQKLLRPSFAELEQMDLVFESDGVDCTNLLRIAVESDLFGKTSRVTLVEVDESGIPLRVFRIPLDVANVVEMKPKPINVDPPILGVKEIAEESGSAAAEDQFGSTGSKS